MQTPLLKTIPGESSEMQKGRVCDEDGVRKGKGKSELNREPADRSVNPSCRCSSTVYLALFVFAMIFLVVITVDAMRLRCVLDVPAPSKRDGGQDRPSETVELPSPLLPSLSFCFCYPGCWLTSGTSFKSSVSSSSTSSS